MSRGKNGPPPDQETTETRPRIKDEARKVEGEVEKKIQSASGVLSLCDAISSAGEHIHGSDKDYTPGEVIVRIKQAVETGDLSKVTRALGIREKLINLFTGEGAKVTITSEKSGNVYTGTLLSEIDGGTNVSLGTEKGIYIPRGGAIEEIGPREGRSGYWFRTSSGWHRVEAAP